MQQYYRYILILFFLASFTRLVAQVSISNTDATADDEITITYDATQGTSGLVGAQRVFMHSGVILSGPTGTDWKHVVGDWGDPSSLGEMTKVGDDLWEITITPRQYYAQNGLPSNAVVYRLGMVFRSAGPCGGFNNNNTACAEGKDNSNSDIYVDLQAFFVRFDSPINDVQFVDQDELININISCSESSDIELFLNGNSVATASSSTSISYPHTVTGTDNTQFKVIADNGSKVVTDSILLITRTPTVSESRPSGIIDGINYDDQDDTKATLSLWAPNKQSVYVLGDFNDWAINPDFLMKKDGEHFWLEITGLNTGVEYAFQYLVDESIYVADPYSDKILDPDDFYISETSYPDLKPYPSEALRPEWHWNRVSVLETGQTAYGWQVTNFTAPEKEELVIYELLVRDFFEEGQENWQNMMDTLSYFESLGINAIQLMPVMEFNGNDSWGYNPAFMFAPDKYYGSKNKFKEFVDAAHQRGIAVILDIAMNHQDIPGTYVNMYFNFNTYLPTPDNPWMNVTARHPFNVFYDFDHESSYTKTYLDTVNHYWLNEYNVDGFRFDLSKGFTQTNSGSNVGFWGNYDQSRVNLLNRMADEIWSHSPDAYVILEHFADNSEEKVLANNGMMLWGNMHRAHHQLLMGYEEDADITWGYYKNRDWNQSNLISYMESHDEQRIMYGIQLYGNANAIYSTKQLGVALQRNKALASIFYTIPGPKMLWQFGELGYEIDINFNGRTGRKPIKWEYYNDNQRSSLRSVVAEFIRLKTTYSVFNTSDVFVSTGNSLQKQIILKNQPFKTAPLSADEMNAVILANFDITEEVLSVNFPHTGDWYDHFGEEDLNISSTNQNLLLKPGEFRVYFDYELNAPDIILSAEEETLIDYAVYPNPTSGSITITSKTLPYKSVVEILNTSGRTERISTHLAENGRIELDVSGLSSGFYILKVKNTGIRHRILIR